MKLTRHKSGFKVISIKEICKCALGMLCLVSSITVLASPYSVYIVNKDKYIGDHDISIDYTICNDVLEKKPVCTQHNKLHIMHFYPEKIELKNKSDVLYVWQASTYDYDGYIENSYSKIIEGHDKPTLVVSDCAASNRQLLTLDTYGTGKIISCQIANY